MKIRGVSTRWVGRVGLIVAFAWVLATFGCADLRPYRTNASQAGECLPNAEGQLPEEKNGAGHDTCHDRLVEAADTYKLYFFEYDDQGYPFKDTESEARSNLRHLHDDVVYSSDKYSIVTFVHGWKHTAESDDTNVMAFRHFLHELAIYEREMKCDRKIIGVYVGWRGAGSKFVHLGTPGDLIEDATFWSRKEAARRVAQGGIHMLLAAIQGMEDHRNKTWKDSAGARKRFNQSETSQNSEGLTIPYAQQPEICSSKPVRNIVVGHSFGGLIAYSTLEDALIRKIMLLHDTDPVTPEGDPNPELRLLRGDLVVLINPAIEATRFRPLFDMTVNPVYRFGAYQTPLFVSVTSVDDYATRFAFPAGRLINEVTKEYLDDEAAADRTTLGHYSPYVTHTLVAGDEYLAQSEKAAYNSHTKPIVDNDSKTEKNNDCAAWTSLLHQRRDEAEYVSIAPELWNIIHSINRDLVGTPINADASGFTFPREFCSDTNYRDSTGHAIAEAVPGIYLFPAEDRDSRVSMNSPVWNISTKTPVVNDHGDISNQRLWVFLRQLYEEGAVSLVVQ